jgi:O-antigen/teichoic acid export membrane protein
MNAVADNRTTRAGKTAIVALVQAAVSVGLGLVVAPLMVSSLGQKDYGSWMLINQLVSYLALIDFGNASIARLALASTEYDNELVEKRRVLTSAICGICLTTPLVLAIGVLVAIWCSGVDGSAAAPPGVLFFSTLILVFGYLANRISAVPSYALFGANLAYRSAGLRTFILAGAVLAETACAVSRVGLLGLSVVRFVAQVVLGINLFRTAKNCVPWFAFSSPDLGDTAKQLRRNVPCVVAQWGHIMAEGIEITIIGSLLGPSAIPIYTITTALPRLAFTALWQAMQGGNAGLAAVYSKADPRGFQHVTRQQELIAWGYLAVVLATTVAVNEQFVSLWAGERYYGGVGISLLGLFWQFSMLLTRQYNSALAAAMDFNRMAKVQLVSGVAGIVSATLGGLYLGLSGILIGLVATRAVAVATNARHLRILVGASPRQGLRRLGPQLFVCVMSAAFGFIVSGYAMRTSWGYVVAGACLTSLVAGAMGWWLALTHEDRSGLIARARQLCVSRGGAGKREAAAR